MDLKNLPEITFAESDTETIETNIVSIVEKLLGRTLARADPLRLFLMGIATLIVQQRILIDTTGKQNLLAYATDDNLDHLGVLVGSDRVAATAATTTAKITLSAARDVATTISAGTRITAGDNVLFAIDADTVIQAGGTMATTAATCTETGTAGNGYAIGELKLMVDPVPFVASIVNTTASEGGAAKQSNDDYREQIHEAPEKLSAAGPHGAYKYYTKQASTLIADVAVTSPSAGTVLVTPLLTGGEIPGSEILNKVSTALNDTTIRPLTDYVTVQAPAVINYDVSVEYWIDRDDATAQGAIQTAITNAVDNYILWQKSKLGRDINPTELYYLLRAAGAKRAKVTTPTDTAVGETEVAVAQSVAVTYGGLEDG